MLGNHKLTPKQLKIARVRPPRNKITGADLRALRNRRGKKKVKRNLLSQRYPVMLSTRHYILGSKRLLKENSRSIHLPMQTHG